MKGLKRREQSRDARDDGCVYLCKPCPPLQPSRHPPLNSSPIGYAQRLHKYELNELKYTMDTYLVVQRSQWSFNLALSQLYLPSSSCLSSIPSLLPSLCLSSLQRSLQLPLFLYLSRMCCMNTPNLSGLLLLVMYVSVNLKEVSAVVVGRRWLGQLSSSTEAAQSSQYCGPQWSTFALTDLLKQRPRNKVPPTLHSVFRWSELAMNTLTQVSPASVNQEAVSDVT